MFHRIQITLFVDNLTDAAAQTAGEYLVREGLDTLLGIEVSKSSYVKVERIDEEIINDEVYETPAHLGFYTMEGA